MTPALRQFLADWLAWAEAGAPEHPVFVRGRGLCGCAFNYGGYMLRHEVRKALDFVTYPFGGGNEFHIRMEDRTQHENPARLAWVRHQLGVEG
jgi:hypothetical protein